ncbi:MAG: periplasmic heavy metal sensor [Shimia sp.]|jgi:uncharacterized membrane protein|uniref:periplasmic heavy metal sensor n=1 Tax=Shimia sp. TaxID=1954381 RepID=UPI0040588EE4
MTQDDEQNPKPAPRQRKPLRGVLIASLALNLLVVGVVGGAMLSFRHGGGDAPHPRDRFVTPHIKALSREDRRAVGREIRNAFRESGTGYASDREMFTAVVVALRQGPFDAGAFDAALAAMEDNAKMRRDVARAQLVKRVASMTDAERAVYAERLEDHLKRGCDPKNPGDCKPKKKKSGPKD